MHLTYAELFAGAGGLSMGLEMASRPPWRRGLRSGCGMLLTRRENVRSFPRNPNRRTDDANASAGH